MDRKKIKTILLGLGILSFVFAFMIFVANVGYNESDEYYGGDAYTGIQQAAAQTANNVVDLAELLQCGLACILVIHGGVLTGISACIEVPTEDDKKEVLDYVTNN